MLPGIAVKAVGGSGAVRRLKFRVNEKVFSLYPIGEIVAITLHL